MHGAHRIGRRRVPGQCSVLAAPPLDPLGVQRVAPRLQLRLARFDEERAYLSSMGVPAEFLPTAREFGRLDLLRPTDVP